MFKTSLFYLAIIVGTNLYSSQMEKIKVILNVNEAPPFFSKDLPSNGMCGEIIHEMSKAAGLDTEIQFKPLSRMIKEDNNNDVGDPAFFMPHQDFISIIPIALYHVAFYHYYPDRGNHTHTHTHTHTHKTIRSLSDIGESRLGILKGSLIEPMYFKSKGIIFETSYSDDSLFRKLQLKRLDYVIAIELVGNHTIERLFPSHEADFISFHIEKNVNPIAIMLSGEQKDATVIAKKYKEGLHEIIANGTYAKILEKYYASKEKIHSNWYNDLNKFAKLYAIEGAE